MRILAIETTERLGTAAALDGPKLLSEMTLDAKLRSAQSLAPAVRQLLADVHWQPGDVQLVAVTVGPGSFTGLRVGVTMAKVFAYAVGADVLGVDTLAAIAAGVPDEIATVSVAVDAQRGQVVANTFHRAADGWFAADGPSRLLGGQEWLSGLPAGTAVAGPILARLAASAPSHVRVLDAKYWPPRAGQVGRLALRDHAAGRRDDVWSLLPRYSRLAAAEEKLMQSPPGPT